MPARIVVVVEMSAWVVFVNSKAALLGSALSTTVVWCSAPGLLCRATTLQPLSHGQLVCSESISCVLSRGGVVLFTRRLGWLKDNTWILILFTRVLIDGSIKCGSWHGWPMLPPQWTLQCSLLQGTGSHRNLVRSAICRGPVAVSWCWDLSTYSTETASSWHQFN